jgi:hypothetical protein
LDFADGPQPLPVNTPDFAGGSLGITDPRTSPNHTYFNTSLFTSSAIGQEGSRRSVPIRW